MIADNHKIKRSDTMELLIMSILIFFVLLYVKIWNKTTGSKEHLLILIL